MQNQNPFIHHRGTERLIFSLAGERPASEKISAALPQVDFCFPASHWEAKKKKISVSSVPLW
jgi:hypothetical protein